MANNNQDSDSATKFAEDMDELTGKDKRDENAEAREEDKE